MKNTDKLTWLSSHVPLSVSVCSNVPGFEDPKCFVSNGDPDQFITEFMQYLVSISTKSASILREQFAPVFEALKQVPNRDDSTEDRLAQILVDIQEGSQQAESEEGEDNDEENEDDNERDIDLMASDNEEDAEEIEPEKEEDRAFLDDETQEQEDVSFYRRFHVELDRGIRQERRQQRDELAQYESVLFGKEHTTENKVLTKLPEKLMPIYKNYPC